MKFTKNIILKNGKMCLIRNAVRDDAQEVLNIFLSTHEQTDFLSSYKDEITFDVTLEEQFLTEKENSDKEVYLCAVVDSSIIGIGSLNQKGQNKIRHRAEFGMAIEEDFWGIGIGRALAMSCIECAKNAGYLQLELEVASENSKAIALYESIGFVEFGRNPRGFISRYKGWQELVSMRLELN